MWKKKWIHDKFLIEHGANLNAKCNHHGYICTPLKLIHEKGNESIK